MPEGITIGCRHKDIAGDGRTQNVRQLVRALAGDRSQQARADHARAGANVAQRCLGFVRQSPHRAQQQVGERPRRLETALSIGQQFLREQRVPFAAGVERVGEIVAGIPADNRSGQFIGLSRLSRRKSIRRTQLMRQSSASSGRSGWLRYTSSDRNTTKIATPGIECW